MGEAAIGFDSRASDLVGFEALESLSCATRGRHQRDRAIVRLAAVVVRFTVEPTVFEVARGRVLDIATRGLTPVRLSVVCLAGAFPFLATVLLVARLTVLFDLAGLAVAFLAVVFPPARLAGALVAVRLPVVVVVLLADVVGFSVLSSIALTAVWISVIPFIAARLLL
ncbi:hypothetical protein ABIA31_003585 [Catenulispora sp. MAP5-51]|uniref:hypothetical protein n=1 Tax=Catenulispora sp. MAP5-51 TaxID=3156298 RepID=UPI003516AFBA